jgi:penicillin-binding protein 2
MAFIGLGVLAIGLFVLADHLGGATLSGDSTSPDSAAEAPVSTEDDADDTETPTVVVPPPDDLESAREVADAFAQLWANEDYRGMYELLTTDVRQTMTREEFVERYEGIAREMGQTEVETEITGAIEEAGRYTITVRRESSRVGPFEDRVVIALVNENGRARVDWTPSMIVAELGDGLVRWRPDVPQRGRILDRNGRPLAHLGTISKVGVIPGQIEDEERLLQDLSGLLGMSEERIQGLYSGGAQDWFMPLKNFPDQMDPNLLQQLNQIPGVSVQKWPERVYPLGPAAAHVVGYLTEVTAEELPALAERGYAPGDVIGRTGIEAWADEYLSGSRGGRLVVLSRENTERRTIAQSQSQPSADVVLTIDIDLQMAAYRALGDNVGSVTIVDPADGAILAMVSSPTFDPNQFILGHTNETWAEVNNPETRPLENRATSFAYALGSVFKVVTMAAGMEHLDLSPQTMIPCPGEFSLPGADQVWRDWSPGGQGTLSLHNALVQSCNTVFYQIGADLDTQNNSLLPDVTKAFGFGRQTGLVELREASGVVPDASWKLSTFGDFWARGDAVNLSIGQGFFSATPLQVAVAYAAISNGGTLYQPFLVREITGIDGEVVYEAEIVETGRLPVGDDVLEAIRAALRDVPQAPNGTATEAFAGAGIPTSGKTGTAENDQGAAHAWYALLAPDDSPEMAMITMVEHGGEGSRTSAPIARQIIDAYAALRR